jgi:hypothetical protein
MPAPDPIIHTFDAIDWRSVVDDGTVPQPLTHTLTHGLPAARFGAVPRQIEVTYTLALSPETAALVWAQAQRPPRPTLKPAGIGYRPDRPPPIRPLYAFTNLARTQQLVERASAMIQDYALHEAPTTPWGMFGI